MKIVILAGGKGTRLGLEGVPKPMVPVDGVPLLERLVEMGKRSGFKEFIFLNGYLGDVIEAHFGDGAAFGVTIEHVTESVPLGTAGAIRVAKDLLTEPFIVIYGDILIDVDLRHFAEFALAKGGVGSLFVHPNDHPHDSDLLEADEEGRIIRFYPKPHAEGQRLPNLVSAALYVLYPRALDYVADDESLDWGKDIFQELIRHEALHAYRSCEYAKDIGTRPRLEKAEGHLRSGRVARLSRSVLKPVIFFDRDGVINEERDGIYAPDQIRLLPGAAEALKEVNTAGIPAICVTNQPGLAKGLFSWDSLRAVHAEMDCQLAETAGSYFDDIYVCPHHPEAGWPGEIAELKIECDCRKPKPGMLKQAAAFHTIDLRASWLIGDRYCDIAAAKAVGMRAVRVRTGHNGNDRNRFDVEADLTVDTVREAVGEILKVLT